MTDVQKFPEGWSLITKINYLQRKIILNSIAYYEFDMSPLSDYFYDSMCRQLVCMHEEYGDIRDTKYGYAFADFDGSTGFDLYSRLIKQDQDYLMNIAQHALSDLRKEKKL